MACQLPCEVGLPLSRFSRADLRRHVLAHGIVAEISGTTIWRWLQEDALRPWTRRSWIFPRDPEFGAKAGRVLDLYHGVWEAKSLGPDDFVLSADEKSQIQIRHRHRPPQPPGPGRAIRTENDYERRGVCAYLAAWDVRNAQLFGDVVPNVTIVTFDSFVAHVMSTEPYRSARRVFWVVDQGTVHRGERARNRLQAQWPNLVLVHLPTHASWLNQIEIYFSILQRKALTPDDFGSADEIKHRILQFQNHYQQIAEPFRWQFTREDLHRVLEKCEPQLIQKAA